MGFTIGLYGTALIFLAISFTKDRKKTKAALRKGWKALEGILPQFLGIIVLMGILLAFLDPPTISKFIGRSSGWLGALAAGVIGAVTLIPGMIAFPTAAILLRNGAGYLQIAAFISTLMMVGIVTLPVERSYFGWKPSIIRNSLAFLFSFMVAFVVDVVCRL